MGLTPLLVSYWKDFDVTSPPVALEAGTSGYRCVAIVPNSDGDITVDFPGFSDKTPVTLEVRQSEIISAQDIGTISGATTVTKVRAGFTRG